MSLGRGEGASGGEWGLQGGGDKLDSSAKIFARLEQAQREVLKGIRREIRQADR
jgi:hypothetical protein